MILFRRRGGMGVIYPYPSLPFLLAVWNLACFPGRERRGPWSAFLSVCQWVKSLDNPFHLNSRKKFQEGVKIPGRGSRTVPEWNHGLVVAVEICWRLFPGKSCKKDFKRFYTGCRQAMILFRRRGGMGVTYRYCSLPSLLALLNLACFPGREISGPWSACFSVCQWVKYLENPFH